MAEAVVEEIAAMPARFYCHMCNVEINIQNADFTCPLCAGGFVEELPPLNAVTPAASTSTPESNQEYNLPLDIDVLRNELASLLASRNGPNFHIAIDPESGRVNTSGNLLTITDDGANASGGGGGGGGGGGSRNRAQNLDRFDNVLLNFLLSISGDNEMPTFGDSPMIFMGNLGDYAWGREGLDTIVTQLLNQMEASGPPPLSKQKIDEIPKVEVTEEEVNRKLQCSVCWEDFVLKTSVRKLPCTHLFHEECIVPWLNLHGTCPICRKLLNDDGDDNDVNMESRDGANNDGNSATNSGANTDARGLTSRQQQQQQQQQQRRRTRSLSNIFGFDEMDFSYNDLD